MKKNLHFYLADSQGITNKIFRQYEFPWDFAKFCRYVVMTIEKDLSHIAKAVALANASKNAVAPQFAGLMEELKQEALAEKLVVEHGVQNASKQEIEQEFDSLDAVESDRDKTDEDDEEQTDMDCVSSSFADLFDTIES